MRELEDHNFRVDSSGWTRKVSHNEVEYLEAPEGDMWEVIGECDYPELVGEQLFTWDAALRETEKAGKIIPTEKEWDRLVRVKEGVPNLTLVGYFLGYVFHSFGSGGYYWALWSNQSKAKYRGFFTGCATIHNGIAERTYGFSVRCLKKS